MRGRDLLAGPPGRAPAAPAHRRRADRPRHAAPARAVPRRRASWAAWSTWSTCSASSPRPRPTTWSTSRWSSSPRCSRPSGRAGCRSSPSTATPASSARAASTRWCCRELAYDDEIFEQKVLDNELYYYGHEKQQHRGAPAAVPAGGQQRLDARGAPGVRPRAGADAGQEALARGRRGLAALLRQPPATTWSASASGGEASVPYLLCFRSERGRNYDRVFRQLLGELQRLRRAGDRQVVVYIITHGQCHIATRAGGAAAAAGVPLRRLHPALVRRCTSTTCSLLHRHQIVAAEALASRESSVDRALEIVDEAAALQRRAAGARPEASALASIESAEDKAGRLLRARALRRGRGALPRASAPRPT